MSMLLFELSQLLQTLVEILPGLGAHDDGRDNVVSMMLVGGGLVIFVLSVHFSVMMAQVMAVMMMPLGRVGFVLLGQDGGHRHGSFGGILIHRVLSAGCVHGGRRGGG